MLWNSLFRELRSTEANLSVKCVVTAQVKSDTASLRSNCSDNIGFYSYINYHLV